MVSTSPRAPPEAGDQVTSSSMPVLSGRWFQLSLLTIAVLGGTGRLQLAYGLLATVGLALGG